MRMRSHAFEPARFANNSLTNTLDRGSERRDQQSPIQRFLDGLSPPPTPWSRRTFRANGLWFCYYLN